MRSLESRVAMLERALNVRPLLMEIKSDFLRQMLAGQLIADAQGRYWLELGQINRGTKE